MPSWPIIDLATYTADFQTCKSSSFIILVGQLEILEVALQLGSQSPVSGRFCYFRKRDRSRRWQGHGVLHRPPIYGAGNKKKKENSTFQGKPVRKNMQVVIGSLK